jgi:hypothetical protein
MEDLFQEIAVEATTLQHSEMRTRIFLEQGAQIIGRFVEDSEIAPITDK